MILNILQISLTRCFWTVLLLLAVLIPVMVLFEYARHYRIFEKSAPYFKWLTRCLSLSPAAAFPLVTGLVFGVIFGAAVLIECARQELLTKRDLMLLGLFLSLNHSIVEDNLIFTALGANFFTLLLSRFVIAIIATRIAALFLDRNKRLAGLKTAPSPGKEYGK
ncbi:MAG: nucleoside recognition protein [Bacillota bacterium]